MPIKDRRRVSKLFCEVACGDVVLPGGLEVSKKIPRAILAADESQGVQFLGSSRVMRAGNPVLHAALLELMSFERVPKTSYRAMLRAHVDATALWGLCERWKCGREIVSRRKNVHGERTDDALAGELLLLGAYVDPKTARAQVSEYQRISEQDHHIVKMHIKDVAKVLRKA